MKRTKALLGLCLFIILGLVVVQVAASNNISTAGIELSKLQTELKEVKRQNSLLKEKMLSLSSLNRIASKAGEMGFVEGKKTIYISSPLPLARN